VHDYEEVVANVGGLFFESPFVSNEEEWGVENESDGGFGAVVSQPNGAWLKVGSLIGIRREDGVSWGAAIVRRVTLDENGNRYAGIEILARGGAAVTILAASTNAKDSRIPPDGELCILLPSATVHTGEETLLMRPGLFSPARALVMRAYDHQYLLVPAGLMRSGDEFDLGRYRILRQLP
jgi:cyclic-di-GMP-binding protein